MTRNVKYQCFMLISKCICLSWLAKMSCLQCMYLLLIGKKNTVCTAIHVLSLNLGYMRRQAGRTLSHRPTPSHVFGNLFLVFWYIYQLCLSNKTNRRLGLKYFLVLFSSFNETSYLRIDENGPKAHLLGWSQSIRLGENRTSSRLRVP